MLGDACMRGHGKLGLISEVSPPHLILGALTLQMNGPVGGLRRLNVPSSLPLLSMRSIKDIFLKTNESTLLTPGSNGAQKIMADLQFCMKRSCATCEGLIENIEVTLQDVFV